LGALRGVVLAPADQARHGNDGEDGTGHDPGAPALPPQLEIILPDGVVDFLESGRIGHGGS